MTKEDAVKEIQEHEDDFYATVMAVALMELFPAMPPASVLRAVLVAYKAANEAAGSEGT